jgi:hypothetical protein
MSVSLYECIDKRTRDERERVDRLIDRFAARIDYLDLRVTPNDGTIRADKIASSVLGVKNGAMGAPTDRLFSDEVALAYPRWPKVDDVLSWLVKRDWFICLIATRCLSFRQSQS